MDLAENDERRAIHFAVINRKADAVELLMEAGSDAHKGIYPNRTATTASSIAKDREYTEITAVIDQTEQRRREKVSCPNATVTPLQEQINASIRRGEIDDAIARLSSDTTLVNACDRDGKSPLHVASESFSDAMAEWLLAHGADVNKLDSDGWTPLERAVFAVESRKKGSREHFRLLAIHLLSSGARNSLPAGIALGDCSFVENLFAVDPMQFTPGNMPVNPLSIAVRHRQLDMVRLLLDLGLDPDERVRLKNLEGEVFSASHPLWHAVVGDEWDIALLLLDRGADPNAVAYASGTPTATAFSTRNVRMQ